MFSPAQLQAAEELNASIAHLRSHLAEAGPTASLAYLVRQFADGIGPVRHFLDNTRRVISEVSSHSLADPQQGLLKLAALLDSLSALPEPDLVMDGMSADSRFRLVAAELVPALPLPSVDDALYVDDREKTRAFFASKTAESAQGGQS